MVHRLSGKPKLKSLIKVTSTATMLYGGICIYQNNENFYNEFIVLHAQFVAPEIAHNAAVKVLKWGLLPGQSVEDPASLAVDVWGLQFKTPIGMAASFDKQGEAVEGMHKIGFSCVEIDLSDSEKQNIADAILQTKSKLDGLILCNTTVSRNNLTCPLKEETGGLSEAPLSDVSTAMVSNMYKRTRGSVPIIGVGGIFTGADAYDKIKAGASLVQAYTSFTYRGPPVIGKIKRELEDMLKRDGLASIKDAVGKDANVR